MLFSRLQGYPDEWWVKERIGINHHTPDLFRLEQSEFQLLFVVDAMQRGQSEYSHIAEHSAMVTKAFTMQNYNLYVKNSDKTVIPMLGSATSLNSLKILGEVHSVESTKFFELDKLKGNLVQFQRKRVRVVVPHRFILKDENRDIKGRRLPLCLQGKKGAISPERIHLLSVWMYVGNPDYWDSLLDGGFLFSQPEPKVPYEPDKRKWLKRFYKYTE